MHKTFVVEKLDYKYNEPKTLFKFNHYTEVDLRRDQNTLQIV